MTVTRRSWLALGVIGVFCAAALGILALVRLRGIFTSADFLDRLPTRESTVVFIDLRVLRSAKLLDALSPGENALDPEYRAFIAGTGFDYLKDLDYLFVSFHSEAMFTFAGGRFNWAKLTAYAKAEGGQCLNFFCRMAGSTPARQISFFALRPNALAMAVGPDSWAATRLQDKTADRLPGAVPDSPVWVSIPKEKLANAGPLGPVQSGIAAAVPDGERISLQAALKDGNLEFVASVRCRSVQESQVLKARIEGAAADFRAAASKTEFGSRGFAPLLEGAVVEITGEKVSVRLPGALPAIRSILFVR
ncbi:MAG: hypothetical protein EXQ52_05800 [Bryobacterales bacterium]|nr:hypothetical protein [Bryobacterales bacterium]